ncbi:MAG: hypothetical protein M3Z09_14730 [Acidobacteriota bacterium]|nr:hypothetical protein [Acidobacteriota bacterium]
MIHTLRIAVLSVAAAAVASAASYKVNIPVAVVLEGQALEPGVYRVDVNDTGAVLRKGKQSIETKIRTEAAEHKYDSTSVRYLQSNGNYNIAEIHVGGTKTKLVFDTAKPVSGGF